MKIVRNATPILTSAGIYCSPWCGFKCTHAAYQRAQKEGAELASRMGDGWELSVWENCGWHYVVSKGMASIRPKINGSAIGGEWEIYGYMVMFNASSQIIAHANMPEDALGFAAQDVRTLIKRLQNDLADISQ